MCTHAKFLAMYYTRWTKNLVCISQPKMDYSGKFVHIESQSQRYYNVNFYKYFCTLGYGSGCCCAALFIFVCLPPGGIMAVSNFTFQILDFHSQYILLWFSAQLVHQLWCTYPHFRKLMKHPVQQTVQNGNMLLDRTTVMGQILGKREKLTKMGKWCAKLCPFRIDLKGLALRCWSTPV